MGKFDTKTKTFTPDSADRVNRNRAEDWIKN